MLTDEVKKSITGLTKEEILNKMRSGEIVPPPKGEDRNEFLRLSSMDPDERGKELSLENPDDSTKQETIEPDNKGTDSSSVEDAPATQKDVPQGKPWWEEDGYTSEQEAVENNRKIRSANVALQTSLDNLNAKEGKRGLEYKKLKEEHERLLSERDELMKKANPEPTEPVKPTRPNPNDYDDGRLDDGYLAAQDQYLEDMTNYNEQFVEFKLAKKAGELEKTVTNIKGDINNQLSETVNANAVDPIERIFKEDVPKFQKEYGLEMSVDPWTVNQTVLNLQSNDPGVRARAEQFVETFPPADKAKWAKILRAVNTAYDTSDGQVTKKYQTIEGALYDNGLLGSEYTKVTPTDLSTEKSLLDSKKSELEGSVSVPQATSAANNDQIPTSVMSAEEEQKKYKELLTEYNMTINKSSQKQFEESPKFGELKALRAKLFGGRLPSYMR